MSRIVERTTATVSLMGIEILALKKLSLVSHALASKLDGQARAEQKVLASVLDDLIRQIEINGAR